MLNLIKFSFLAGIILNFMPCIIPILGIKLNALSKSANLKKLALSTVLGILSFMMLLAGVFLVLKALHIAFNLGIYFQNHIFIMLVIIIFVSMIFSFFGYSSQFVGSTFVPQFLHNTLMKIEKKLHMNHEIISGFCSGFLIVSFSAACTTPIISATFVTAFMNPNPIAIPVSMFFMGIGLSLPYITAAFFPRYTSGFLANKSITSFIRKAVIAMTLSTIFWLFYILFKQIGLLYSATFAASVLIGAFIARKTQKSSIAMLLMITIFIFELPFISTKIKDKNSITNTWHEFNTNEIQTLVNANRIVFVKISADWCVSCKIADALLLNTKDMLKFYEQNNIYAMKGDVTKYNKEISAFLTSKNAAGVPYIAIFSKSHPNGLQISPFITIYELQETITQNINNK